MGEDLSVRNERDYKVSDGEIVWERSEYIGRKDDWERVREGLK